MKIVPPIRKQPPIKRLSLRNRTKYQSQFWRRPFFFFFFGGKNLRISEIGRKITLNFGEDLFFFFGDHVILGGNSFEFPSFPRHFSSSFGQTVGQFESRSFAHFSLFQNSPPLFQILATRLLQLVSY